MLKVEVRKVGKRKSRAVVYDGKFLWRPALVFSGREVFSVGVEVERALYERLKRDIEVLVMPPDFEVVLGREVVSEVFGGLSSVLRELGNVERLELGVAFGRALGRVVLEKFRESVDALSGDFVVVEFRAGGRAFDVSRFVSMVWLERKYVHEVVGVSNFIVGLRAIDKYFLGERFKNEINEVVSFLEREPLFYPQKYSREKVGGDEFECFSFGLWVGFRDVVEGFMNGLAEGVWRKIRSEFELLVDRVLDGLRGEFLSLLSSRELAIAFDRFLRGGEIGGALLSPEGARLLQKFLLLEVLLGGKVGDGGLFGLFEKLGEREAEFVMEGVGFGWVSGGVLSLVRVGVHSSGERKLVYSYEKYGGSFDGEPFFRVGGEVRLHFSSVRAFVEFLENRERLKRRVFGAFAGSQV